MDQAAPSYYNYTPTQYGPSYMGVQYQQQYHGNYNYHEQHPPTDPFVNAVNTEVWTAVQAARSMDAQSLHIAYANLGFVLGIDKACTYFVQSYSASRGVGKLFFKKDWENLEAMVADIDDEKKISHVEQFMRRRRIPGYVSLHEPDTFVGKSDLKMVKQEEILCGDADLKVRGEVMRLDAACQTQDYDKSVMSLNVACQTEKFRGSEAGCQTEKCVGLEVACQTVKKCAEISVSCQTTPTCEKSPRKSADKLVRKDSDKRKRARDDDQDSNGRCSVSSDDARSKVSSQDAKVTRKTKGCENKKLSHSKIEKIIGKDSKSRKRRHDDQSVSESKRSNTTSTMQSKVCIPIGTTLCKGIDDKKSSSKSKNIIMRKDSSDNHIAEVSNEKSSSKTNGKIVRKDSPDNSKRIRDDKLENRGTDRSTSHSQRSISKSDITKSVSPPRCKKNMQISESSDCPFTKLVIGNLHPQVTDVDISVIFSAYKSYKSCKVNLCNYDKLGAAEVTFEEEADAVEAQNQFDGKNLDGYPMHIIVIKSEKN